MAIDGGLAKPWLIWTRRARGPRRLAGEALAARAGRRGLVLSWARSPRVGTPASSTWRHRGDAAHSCQSREEDKAMTGLAYDHATAVFACQRYAPVSRQGR